MPMLTFAPFAQQSKHHRPQRRTSWVRVPGGHRSLWQNILHVWFLKVNTPYLPGKEFNYHLLWRGRQEHWKDAWPRCVTVTALNATTAAPPPPLTTTVTNSGTHVIPRHYCNSVSPKHDGKGQASLWLASWPKIKMYASKCIFSNQIHK